MCVCQSSVKCVGHFLSIGSQASAAIGKIYVLFDVMCAAGSDGVW